MPRAVGAFLRDLREAQGKSLRDVEADTGVSSGHLSLIETGRVRNPSPTILQKLATHFGVSAEHLLVLAGYLKPKDPKSRNDALHGVALAAMKDLSDDEVAQIAELVTVMRKRRERER